MDSVAATLACALSAVYRRGMENPTNPWNPTPHQSAVIDAVRAVLTLVRGETDQRLACETHDDTAGYCTEECVSLVYAMMGDPGPEYPIYDPTGCHRSRSMPGMEYHLDPERKVLVGRTVHPEDCECGRYSCPQEIDAAAYTAVMGDHTGESWTLTESGWLRVS